MLKCAITGANSQLGQQLAKCLQQHNYEVVALSRAAPASDLYQDWIPWRFNAELDPDALRAIDLLIHCAWDMSISGTEENQRINVAGSIKLLRQFGAAKGKRIIFISSSSVYEGMSTVYGKSKKEVEDAVSAEGGMIVRPGLIYGDTLGGILAKLEHMVKKLPVIPLLGSGQQQFVTVHIEDLCQAVLLLIQNPDLYEQDHQVLAYPNFVSFLAIIKAIEHKCGVHRLKIPFPWRFMYFMLRFIECLHLKPPFKSDSLLSLMRLDPHPRVNRHFIKMKVFRPFTLSA